MSTWVVYILHCRGGSLYTGITTNIEKRLKAHNAGVGAKYTRAHIPVKLAWSEPAKNESLAKKREAAIKKLSHKDKLNLLD